MILPILVRQAEANEPISYGRLALEAGMPNPRNLNHPLGRIGGALLAIGKKWREEVPHIQSLVINSTTRVPGEGFDGFLAARGYVDLALEEKRPFLKEYWSKIFAYPWWGEVLEECELERTQGGLEDVLDGAAGLGVGEGPEHARLKEFIRKNPDVVGLTNVGAPGRSEYPLPSGDSVDLMFTSKGRSHAVEVKPSNAGYADLARGLFQCVKYRAVLTALARFEQTGTAIDVRLAIGGALPAKLFPLRNSLNVRVIENVKARRT
ncbi:hypothetical protein [Methylobacterium indicum]|nr:hypothetical protein [Methylobacterium indicum]